MADPFHALWLRDFGQWVEVTVVGFTDGDAVVVLEDGSFDRARLRDLRLEYRRSDWPRPVLEPS